MDSIMPDFLDVIEKNQILSNLGTERIYPYRKAIATPESLVNKTFPKHS